ncbi:hypothetical protein AGABI2DRAFT_212615 [Agaricus bisporus var. bisporus H97]|uniref:hypothetical protein n=1 Tax=Agaricus bisporus var. bisporus (strain H97 / ATCC MYA-4626 / FGSC 10389) TaxID=936046 RepID=UPI00029F5D57|nr:hypothetical protein AGABI2DRAFT_212615 [Agaricus bisporus var. bisporus H97]EKV42017.1 hypothetical protein AGABI2DRAFT_212615 [Agaricus bisporus var. bisporus H97]
MSSSSPASSATSAAPAASSSVAGSFKAPANLKVVGIILAIVSGILIGSSFVFKKKGLLRSQAGGELGEGVAYLKSALWWTGMIMMILGEICNFAAYAFVEAIVVTPLGALSVVICAILSSFFLKEKLTFFGWLGCGLCLLGSTIIALNGPHEDSVGQIREFQKLFLAPGFLAYAGVLIVVSLVIIFYFAPRYGKKNMLWYIGVCSMIGGISVSVTTGLGAAIVTTAMGDNQFDYWFTYFLAAFIIITLITEVYYLNVALALFNTVTPTYYVIFTFCSIVTTIVLFKGLQASVLQIITLVMAFLVICVGITILQMSKVDPTQLKRLDRRSTILLQAARSQTDPVDEKDIVAMEDPGIDALRGSFGTFGSMARAKRMSQRSSRMADLHPRPSGATARSGLPYSHDEPLRGMKRHQLYDAPVRKGSDTASLGAASITSLNKRPTVINFASQDVIHSYNPHGKKGGDQATHIHRAASGNVPIVYPPIPPPKSPRPEFPRVEIPKEDNLLEIETDSPETAVAVIGDDSQIGVVPPHVDRSLPQEARSAPPTMYARFRSPPRATSNKDLRHIFNSSQSSTTLLTFPSVTDSARSEGWDEEELQRRKQEAREKDRGRSARRYPRGDGEDDREESESLWIPIATEDSPTLEGGGIRLVHQSTRGDNS